MRKSGVENCSLCVNLVAAYGVRSFRKCLILRGRVLQVMRKPTAPEALWSLFVHDWNRLSNLVVRTLPTFLKPRPVAGRLQSNEVYPPICRPVFFNLVRIGG